MAEGRLRDSCPGTPVATMAADRRGSPPTMALGRDDDRPGTAKPHARRATPARDRRTALRPARFPEHYPPAGTRWAGLPVPGTYVVGVDSRKQLMQRVVFCPCGIWRHLRFGGAQRVNQGLAAAPRRLRRAVIAQSGSEDVGKNTYATLAMAKAGQSVNAKSVSRRVPWLELGSFTERT
jgi:hypothetical protein